MKGLQQAHDHVSLVCIQDHQDVRIELFALQDLTDLDRLFDLKEAVDVSDPATRVWIDESVAITTVPIHPMIARWCDTCRKLTPGMFCVSCGISLASAAPIIAESGEPTNRPLPSPIGSHYLQIVLFLYKDQNELKPLSACTFFPVAHSDCERLEAYLDTAALPSQVLVRRDLLKPRIIPAVPCLARICPEHGVQDSNYCRICDADLKHHVPSIVEQIQELPWRPSVPPERITLDPNSERRFQTLLSEGLHPRKSPNGRKA